MHRSRDLTPAKVLWVASKDVMSRKGKCATRLIYALQPSETGGTVAFGRYQRNWHCTKEILPINSRLSGVEPKENIGFKKQILVEILDLS